MTTATAQSETHTRTHEKSPRSRGRLAIGITLILSLIASAILQQTAYSFRTEAINSRRSKDAPAPSRLANLDSFSLALLLGGLRGPLVMFLWTSSESQKSERDLESFDTKVEMIRLLQPEFVTVHLFQIWNKIYNISAQLASLSNKYAAILDGINYAEETLKILPDDINIVSAIGGAYADKLGNSQEKDYYRRRVRNETLPVYKITFPGTRLDAFKKSITDAGVDPSIVRITDGTEGTETALVNKLPGDQLLAIFKHDDVKVEAVPRQSLRGGLRVRRTELDTLLDADGNILPQYLKPTHVLAPGVVDNDGSKLQFLARFQPFPYGLSPIAIGYNYQKRAQLLQRVGLQKHVQMSALVIDHEPALTLKAWAEEEWDRARRLEQRGLPPLPNADKLTRELWTSTVAPDSKIIDQRSIDEAIFSYRRSAQIAEATTTEIKGHIAHFPSNVQSFESHLATTRGILHLMTADGDYLQAIAASKPEVRQSLLKAAKSNYEEASKWYHILILRYYIDARDAAAIKYSRSDVDEKMTLPQLTALLGRARAYLRTKYKDPNLNPAIQDLREYDEEIHHIDDRVARIK
jgi:hypothetical protein